jgi:hypothetical protein
MTDNNHKDQYSEKSNSNDYMDGIAAVALIAIVTIGVVVILLNI